MAAELITPCLAYRLRVAILIFDDVEVLDFAGPFEVFGVARAASGHFGFEVLTVALATGEIIARIIYA